MPIHRRLADPSHPWAILPDVIERRRARRRVVVRRHREPDVDARRHAHRLAPDLRPRRAVRRAVAGERVPAAHDPHPERRPGGPAGGVRARPAGRGAPLEGRAVARREDHHGVLRVGGERLADHDPGLRPRVGVAHRRDARHQLAVAVQRLVGKVEAVGCAPDVGPAADHRVDPAGEARAPRAPDRADVAPGECPATAAAVNDREVDRQRRAGRPLPLRLAVGRRAQRVRADRRRPRQVIGATIARDAVGHGVLQLVILVAVVGEAHAPDGRRAGVGADTQVARPEGGEVDRRAAGERVEARDRLVGVGVDQGETRHRLRRRSRRRSRRWRRAAVGQLVDRTTVVVGNEQIALEVGHCVHRAAPDRAVRLVEPALDQIDLRAGQARRRVPWKINHLVAGLDLPVPRAVEADDCALAVGRREVGPLEE